MGQIKIKATLDKDLMFELNKEIFPGDYWPGDESIDWVVLDGKTPVGFCMLSKVDDETCFLSRAGIYKEYQGMGLHTRMIRVRERAARKLGFSRIVTYTKIDNIKSSHNLQKAGYEIYKPATEWADADCIYWLKTLENK